MKGDRLVEAEMELRAILKIEHGNIAAHTLLGITYFKMGDLRNSEQVLSDVLEMQPNQVDAMSLLAVRRICAGL